MIDFIELLLLILFGSITTFGGGAVFVSVFRNIFTVVHPIYTLEEYNRFTVLVNSFPGMIGGKIASYTGYMEYSWLGFFSGYLVMTLPAVIIMLVVYKFFTHIKDTKIMKTVNVFVKPIVIGIFLAIFTELFIFSADSISYIPSIIILVVSFILIDKYKVPPIWLILAAIAITLLFVH